MNARRMLALTAVLLLLITLLAGCGAGSKEMAAEDSISVENGSAAGGSTAPQDGKSEVLTDSAQSGDTITAKNQKLIRKIWLEAETEEMDPLLASVEEQITRLGGYVENREVRNGSRYSGYTRRYGSLTIRIPAEQLDAFVAGMADQANIVSKRETAEDITLSYVATESRMKMLETEHARLLELLASAKDMKEILQIEERLMDVRSELEQVTSQLRVYDNQVNYGTVYLDITEVREYTPVEEEPDGFFQRIGKGFVKSLKNVGDFLVELVIFLIVAIPYLIPIALVVAAVILWVKLRGKKCAKRHPREERPPFPTDKNEK